MQTSGCVHKRASVPVITLMDVSDGNVNVNVTRKVQSVKARIEVIADREVYLILEDQRVYRLLMGVDRPPLTRELRSALGLENVRNTTGTDTQADGGGNQST